MTEPVSASTIAPFLFENEIEDDNEAVESFDGNEDVVDDLTYDVRNLVACNFHPIRLDDDESTSKERLLIDLCQRSTQLLVKRIFECPVERTETGPLAVLPKESFVYPREKRVPEPKPETRWEKYAREKGIKKHKRERMLYDEDSDEWKPRYGYKRAKNGVEDIPIVEVKPGQDPFNDPWEEGRKDKKDRILKNKKNQETNQIRVKGKKQFDSTQFPGIPLDVEDKSKRRGKDGVSRALQLVQHSTQSMGRYDQMRENEPERKLKGKKRVFRDNLSKNDRDSMKAQLRIVEDKIAKKVKGITNSLKAYEGLIPDAPSNEFKKKKGKGKNSGKANKK